MLSNEQADKFTSNAIALFLSGGLLEVDKFSVIFEPVAKDFVGTDATKSLSKVVKTADKKSSIASDDLMRFQIELGKSIEEYFKADVEPTTAFNIKDKVSHKILSISDFLSIPDYPANRDVTRRMNREHMKTLNCFEQARVVIVHIMEKNTAYWDKIETAPQNGVKVMKLDGHSRAYAWKHKQLEAPAYVSAIVYKNLTDEEINRNYDALTSPLTAATSTEQLYTLKKRTGFEPHTKFVSQNWKTAFAHNGIAFNEMTFAPFIKALQKLDDVLVTDFANHKGKECKQPKGINSAGVKAAIIEQLKRDNYDLSQYWTELLTGTEEDRHMILEVSELITVAETAGNGWTGVDKVSRKAMELCTQWESKQTEEATEETEQ